MATISELLRNSKTIAVVGPLGPFGTETVNGAYALGGAAAFRAPI